MPDILLVFTTELNSTRQMADAVTAGVRSVDGVQCEQRLLETGLEIDPSEIGGYDGLIIGTPVRHRNMHYRIKRFIEHALETSWLTDETVGMAGGTFCVGGGHGDVGAGAELCQLGMLSSMAASGFVLVTMPKCTPGANEAGLHWGPVGRSGGPGMEPLWLSEAMLDAGFHHGANIARVTSALAPHRAKLFARGNVVPSPELVKAFGGGEDLRDVPIPEPEANPAYRQQPHKNSSVKPAS